MQRCNIEISPGANNTNNKSPKDDIGGDRAFQNTIRKLIPEMKTKRTREQNKQTNNAKQRTQTLRTLSVIDLQHAQSCAVIRLRHVLDAVTLDHVVIVIGSFLRRIKFVDDFWICSRVRVVVSEQSVMAGWKRIR
jgi:hypothetical protein